jgi:DNA-binding XRE family transcriptional regulator
MVRDIDRSLEKSRHLRDVLDVHNVDQLIPGPSEAELGHLLRELRCMQGLEMDQLARRSGLNADVIAALENGSHGADVATLRRLAIGLGMRVGVIFTLWERRSLAVAERDR